MKTRCRLQKHLYLSKWKWCKIYEQTSQSAENRRKECHRFWLRLRHAVILISNVRISASKKINLMPLIWTPPVWPLRWKERKKNSFGKLFNWKCYQENVECFCLRWENKRQRHTACHLNLNTYCSCYRSTAIRIVMFRNYRFSIQCIWQCVAKSETMISLILLCLNL